MAWRPPGALHAKACRVQAKQIALYVVRYVDQQWSRPRPETPSLSSCRLDLHSSCPDRARAILLLLSHEPAVHIVLNHALQKHTYPRARTSCSRHVSLCRVSSGRRYTVQTLQSSGKAQAWIAPDTPRHVLMGPSFCLSAVGRQLRSYHVSPFFFLCNSQFSSSASWCLDFSSASRPRSCRPAPLKV